jgi:hypothetical protein
MKIMETTTKINQMTRKIVLTIASLLFVMSMNSAQNMYLSHDLVLTGLGKQAYFSNLALKRFVSASPVLHTELETEVALEKWMTNSGDWKDMRNRINFNYLLEEEAEELLEIESWMLENFLTDSKINTITENISDEKVVLESWMVSPSTWGKN